MSTPTKLRTAKYRGKLIATGLKPVTVFVPVDRVPEIRAIAAQWRQEFFNSTITDTNNDRASAQQH